MLTDTSHLFCSANQMTALYIKYNNGVTYVKISGVIISSADKPLKNPLHRGLTAILVPYQAHTIFSTYSYDSHEPQFLTISIPLSWHFSLRIHHRCALQPKLGKTHTLIRPLLYSFTNRSTEYQNTGRTWILLLD